MSLVGTVSTKRVFTFTVCLIIFIFLIFLVPFAAFKHGFFYAEPEFSKQVPTVVKNLELEIVSQEFSPLSDDIKGLVFRISGYKPGMKGAIVASVKDENGKTVCSEKLDVSRIRADGWRQIYFDTNLSKGQKYTLTLHGEKSRTGLPDVVFVEKNSLQNQKENLAPSFAESGKEYVLFASYAYSKQTFTNYEKFLLVLYGYSLLFVIFGWYTDRPRYKIAGLFLICMATLSWNYINNSMDNANTKFKQFQQDSERYVAGAIYARMNGIQTESYGLGEPTTIAGGFTYRLLENPDASFLSNKSVDRGYSLTEPMIVLPINSYTKKYVVPGNQIEFQNGQRYSISSVEIKDLMHVRLNANKPISHVINGSLLYAKILDPAGKYYPSAVLRSYLSQYGLQGKIMSSLAKHFKPGQVYFDFEFICTLITAVVLTLITFLLAVKYNKLFAGVTYVTFWLSPWMVNFARNTYWVDFTWFIPMLIGLVVSIYISERKYRILGYIGATLSILIKSLCGYEYITSVMMGLIVFLIVDVLMSIVERNKSKFKLTLSTTATISIFALLGFVIAIIIHADIRGGGDVLSGIKSIWIRDVMRRAAGGTTQDFSIAYWPSLNASYWEVVCRYFKFYTEVITGLSGNLFPLLALSPFVIFVYDYYKYRKIDFRNIFLYAAMFLTSISWFVLAKPHSYIHTHMNYVLWYFGFVQVCMYVIIKRLITWVERK